LIDYGVVGFMALVSFALYPFIRTAREPSSVMAAAPLAIGAAILILSLTDNPLMYPQAMAVPLIALATMERRRSLDP
jgi:hypothetical protein